MEGQQVPSCTNWIAENLCIGRPPATQSKWNCQSTQMTQSATCWMELSLCTMERVQQVVQDCVLTHWPLAKKIFWKIHVQWYCLPPYLVHYCGKIASGFDPVIQPVRSLFVINMRTFLQSWCHMNLCYRRLLRSAIQSKIFLTYDIHNLLYNLLGDFLWITRVCGIKLFLLK